jgi:hypothetical protein
VEPAAIAVNRAVALPLSTRLASRCSTDGSPSWGADHSQEPSLVSSTTSTWPTTRWTVRPESAGPTFVSAPEVEVAVGVIVMQEEYAPPEPLHDVDPLGAGVAAGWVTDALAVAVDAAVDVARADAPALGVADEWLEVSTVVAPWSRVSAPSAKPPPNTTNPASSPRPTRRARFTHGRLGTL